MKPRIFIPSAIVFIIIITSLIYIPSFNTHFQFDDVKRIVGARVVENLDITDTFRYSKSRFLLYLTFAINYCFGKYNVFGYHLINLIIHILSSLLVFGLSLIIFNSPRLKNPDFKQHRLWLAFFSSIIFALHPLQTESVTYIWQRGESMAGMFYLLSIFLYARFRLSQDNGRVKRSALLLYAASFISIILCSLTKPTSATLAAAILIFEACFLSGNMKEFKASLKYIAPILLLILLPFLLARFDINENKGVGIRLTSYYMPYYYTKIRVLANAVQLMLFPVNQTIEYDFPWSTSLINPVSTLGSLVVLLCLIAVCILSFKRNPLISFAVIWFFLTLSITTILYLDDLFFEHYLYMPLFGYSVIIPALSLNIANTAGISRRWWIACLIILTVSYSMGTYSRNQVWMTEMSLWEDAVKKSPYKARAHYTLGVYYFREKKHEEAFREYNIALKLKPEYPEAYYRLGEYYFSRGELQESIWNYRKALELNPEFFEAYLNLGNIYLAARQYADARACLENALRFTKNQIYIMDISVLLERMKNL